jgi:hypothetical protein
MRRSGVCRSASSRRNTRRGTRVDSVADIDRRAQIYFAVASETGGFPGITVDAQIGHDFFDRAAPCADKNRIALLPSSLCFPSDPPQGWQ